MKHSNVIKTTLGALLIISSLGFTSASKAVPTSQLAFGTLDLELVRNETNVRDAAFTRQVKQAMNDKNWNQLDALGEKADSDCNYSYKGYNDYSTFIGEIDNCGADGFEKRLALIGDWMKVKPHSRIAPVAYAALMTKYAWRARGSGYADEVTSEGWRLFGERLAAARTILEKTAARGIKKTKGWYSAMFTVALGETWDRPRYEALFNEAIKAYPDHPSFYFDKAYWLLPRWNGKDREWEQFAAESADRLGGSKGEELYAQTVWFIQSIAGDDEIKVASIRRLQNGFASMEKNHSAWSDAKISPKSALAKLALARGNTSLARRLFDELGNQVSMYVWNHKYFFVEQRQKAYKS